MLAWAWSRPFGIGEVGLRSLSALIGTLTVPVAYVVGAQLVSRRSGLAAAALVAVSPLLVYYSQEARPYALAILLGGLSVGLFARALEAASPSPRPRSLAAALLALCALAALLRFPTLDLQSFWFDEAVTVVDDLRPSLAATLGRLPSQELAPPLYFVLAWAWSRPFGIGEVLSLIHI